MKVLVVDGQGGKIGKAVVEQLLAANCACEIVAVGTNALATSAMLKAGAKQGATGENAVAVMAAKADVIVGPIGIVAANSLLGEITPRMALAISDSEAQKILIPMQKCKIAIAGAGQVSLDEAIGKAVEMVCAAIDTK